MSNKYSVIYPYYYYLDNNNELSSDLPVFRSVRYKPVGISGVFAGDQCSCLQEESRDQEDWWPWGIQVNRLDR